MNREERELMMKRIRTLLPLQNPLTSFVHNNLLMAWEAKEFWEGSVGAARKYEADFPKPLTFYQGEAIKGRVFDSSLLWALRWEETPGSSWRPQSQSEPTNVETVLLGLLKLAKRHAADPLLRGPSSPGELSFHSWGAPQRERAAQFPAAFREWFCGVLETYLDQGLAPWNNPFRDQGLMVYAKASLEARAFLPNGWSSKMYRALGAQHAAPTLEQLIETSRLSPPEFEEHLLILSFSFKGWMGMINKAETEPGQFPVMAIPVRLEEALVILLRAHEIFFGSKSMVALAREAAAGDEACTVTLAESEASRRVAALGVLPPHVSLTASEWKELNQRLNELDRFRSARVWHHAYEDSLYRVALGALAQGPGRKSAPAESSPNRYQVLTCMDDREESFRRHLEEVSPVVETYGVLGNFNLAIKYLGLGNPKPRQQCPPVVVPERTLYETLTPSASTSETVRQLTRLPSQWEERARAIVLLSTGSWTRGFLSSVFIGFAAMAPLFSRVVFPAFGRRLRGAWGAMARRITAGGDETQIAMEREEHPSLGPCGFTVEEQADNVASVLKPLDIHLNWAPIVIAIAHQSTSDNNPFMQAYGCGACSGNSGVSNSRAFARMANSEEVRAVLRDKHHYFIAPETKFVAAVHDTTSDLLEFHPPHPLSSVQAHVLWRAKRQLRIAAARNSHERTQFFANSVKGIPPTQSVEHCIARSESLAEPRPEYGHNRVAVAVYGPRSWTQSLCLDRRSFLISYHHDCDSKDSDSLRGLIHGSLPVVANIGLDYFFSSIDSHGFGAGSKLPLNISALLGVVSGSRGDLRVGLAHQMIEIHEPVRPMAVVHANKETLLVIIREHARLVRLIGGGWLRIVAYDPSDRKFFALDNWAWVPIDLGEEPLTSLPRWGALNKMALGGPLADGNSLQRWGRKPARNGGRKPVSKGEATDTIRDSRGVHP